MSPGRLKPRRMERSSLAWHVVSAILGRQPAQLLSRSFRILKIMFFGMGFDSLTAYHQHLGQAWAAFIQSSFSQDSVRPRHRDFLDPTKTQMALPLPQAPVIDGVLDER